MTYPEILNKLGRLRDLVGQVIGSGVLKGDEARKAWDECHGLYGELEDVILRFTGIRDIRAKESDVSAPVYRNYIEAMLLSSYRTFHSQGYAELLKVIGKVRQQASDPTIPQKAQSVSDVVSILSRYRECCQYVTQPPQNERDVQDTMWIMLRAHFDRLLRDNALPKFGLKGYKPDFGIPDIGILVEAKFVGDKTNPADIQEEILADIPGYLQTHGEYSGVVVLVYDRAHKLRDDKKFKEDLSKVPGILNVQVIPGIG